MKAIWNGAVLAESETCIVVEGNAYFPPESLHQQYFSKSNDTTICGWKGEASYYNITVNGARNENAAWYYPTPKDAAKEITGYVAFWRGVEVSV